MFLNNNIITEELKIGTISSFNQILFGSASPTSGTFRQGDVMFNTGATSSGFAGWICTVAGTPGTWKTFGLIS